MPKKRSQPSSDEQQGDEQPFPRGGGSGLTPLEERKLRLQAQADFDAERRKGAQGAHKKRKVKGRAEESSAEVRRLHAGTASAGGSAAVAAAFLMDVEATAYNRPYCIALTILWQRCTGGTVWLTSNHCAAGTTCVHLRTQAGGSVQCAAQCSVR